MRGFLAVLLFLVLATPVRAAGHTGTITAVAYSPDGKTLASGSRDKTVILWDTATGKPRQVLKLGDQAICLAFSADGAVLATASGRPAGADNKLDLWDVRSGNHLGDLKTDEPVSAVAYSPDGSVLAYATGPQVRVVDVSTNKRKFFIEYKFAIWSLAFSPDSKWLAVGLVDDVRLLDLSSGNEQSDTAMHYENVKVHGIRTVSFSPDGKVLASAGEYPVLWAMPAGTKGNPIKSPGGSICSTAFTPDSSTLVAGGERLVFIQTDSGKIVDTQASGGDPFLSVSLSPDGKTLATSTGHVIKLWNVKTIKVVQTLGS